MEKTKCIRLYGKLGARFGRVHHLAVATAAEAVKALSVVLPGFRQYLADSPAKYAVFVGAQNISEKELTYPSGTEEIRIAPIPAGAKQGGLFQLIVGIVLIVAGFFTGGSTWGPAMMVLGAGMAISGVMLMSSPQSTGSGSQDAVTNRASYSFNGAVNTVAQGNIVPVLYGELIVGSAVISGGIYAEDRT